MSRVDVAVGAGSRALRAGVRLLPAAAAILVAAGLTPAFAAPWKMIPTTPPGITMIEVVRDGGGDQPVLLFYRPGDANGRTLFASDQDQPGTAKCDGECAQEFPPLTAARDAKAFGDWSIVRRADGSSQWAYQSHPLYTWTKEKVPGDVATNLGVFEHPPPRSAGLAAVAQAAKAGFPGQKPDAAASPSTLTAAPAVEGPLMPPKGWQVVRFTPSAVMPLPDGISLQVVPAAQAVAFTDTDGMTVYAFDGDAKRDGQSCASGSCNVQWLPVAAPTMAMPVGEFSIVSRVDGTKQWAFRSRPLYTYTGDKLPGDVHGVGIAKGWEVAAVTQDFRPANVSVATLDGYGDAMTLRGMTLYGSYMFEHRIGGRNQRNDYTHNSYKKGKALAAQGCLDAKCLSQWHPFTAPADAQPDGWWEPITRADGSKQWAYKGWAIYSCACDKVPFDHSGQAVYDYVDPDGSPANFEREMFFINLSKVKAGAGVYWNIAHP